MLECNRAYCSLVASRPREPVPPPGLAFTSDGSVPQLYRLARCASAGQAHEERIHGGPDRELIASVRPLSDGCTAWWFLPVTGRPENMATAPAPAPPVLSPLFQHAPIGIAVAERDGKILEANRAFVDFFSGSLAIGIKISDLIDGPNRQRVANAIAHAGPAAASASEVCPDGRSDRMGELCIRQPSGEESGKVLLYLTDISEQKSLETKFAQSQKMQAVGQLAGGVAHDFNNLLTVIIGNSEFLLMRHPAGDPSFREINEVHQNAVRAANLVRQLLAFSRQQTMQPRVLDIGVVIGELAEMLRRLLREGITLRVERSADLWPIHADEAQLTNAIINLVVNARDAMPRGGAVVIRTANETTARPMPVGGAYMPSGEYVRVDIRDTGTGIPEEHLGKIFDPFFTTKPVGEGTGLGLATAYGIVKQTGGFITVESEVGKGTTFSIFLPRHHGEPEGRADVPVIRDMTGQETILLVEDEEAVRGFAARALKQRGYNVVEAAGGEQAFDIMKSRAREIDLLITDVVMPVMDGPTLVRAVRQLKPDVRVIFMSGYAEEAFRRHDARPEDFYFLPKPFGLKQLAAKVKEVLSGATVH